MALALPMGASAADTDSSSAATSATKSANVTVTGGSLEIAKDTNGMLEAPSFAFQANVSATAQDGLTTKDYTNTDASDTYKYSKLYVDDNTGTGNGWHVTAQLGAFSDGASHDLSGAELHVISTGTKSDGGTAATAPTADLIAGADAASVVFNAVKGGGLGTSTTDLGGSTLDIPSANYKGTYTAALTYTLTSGPDSTTA